MHICLPSLPLLPPRIASNWPWRNQLKPLSKLEDNIGCAAQHHGDQCENKHGGLEPPQISQRQKDHRAEAAAQGEDALIYRHQQIVVFPSPRNAARQDQETWNEEQ
mmetsp:Transcript_10240/g.22310  ORF Transcript_10240/g.22310 Transcript_10240/m.22310 type:complete len:106 (+) Transcript_10240:6-323(+)